MLRSVGCRFHLYADFTRYYSSIYTHSIGWALHGLAQAQADEHTQLVGNQIDRLVRNTQARQSIGIPVGPDSSLIIAELIATAIDLEIQSKTRGLRFVDDFHLYFRSRGECENAIANLHRACRKFGLDINDAKTLIEELPDVVEPAWKTALRTFSFAATKRSATTIMGYFNLAFDLFASYPSDGVLKYAVKRSEGIGLNDFSLYLAMLCRCAIADPTCVPEVLRILTPKKAQIAQIASPDLELTLEELCRYHAPLHHGYEVAWAVWGAAQFGVRISDATAKLICEMDDDTVALVTLHANELGLLNASLDHWRTWTTTEQLSNEHWLVAYEASLKGWLPCGTSDHINDHLFFKTLRANDVSFYDRTPTVTEENNRHSIDTKF